MIDLTNKSIDEVNQLIQKYAKVLEIIRPEEQPYLAVLIDVAHKYIVEKYKDLTADWKTWCIIALKKERNKIHRESDVPKIIDEFVEYYKNEYQKYVNNLGVFASEFDRDMGFVYTFSHKKNR